MFRSHVREMVFNKVTVSVPLAGCRRNMVEFQRSLSIKVSGSLDSKVEAGGKRKPYPYQIVGSKRNEYVFVVDKKFARRHYNGASSLWREYCRVNFLKPGAEISVSFFPGNAPSGLQQSNLLRPLDDVNLAYAIASGGGESTAADFISWLGSYGNGLGYSKPVGAFGNSARTKVPYKKTNQKPKQNPAPQEKSRVQKSDAVFCKSVLNRGYCNDIDSCKYSHDLSNMGSSYRVFTVDKLFFYETLESQAWQEQEKLWLKMDGGGQGSASIRLVNGKSATIGKSEHPNSFYIVVHSDEKSEVDAVGRRVAKSYKNWKKSKNKNVSKEKKSKKICFHLQKSGHCKAGRQCSYSHNIEDLNVPSKVIEMDGKFARAVDEQRQLIDNHFLTEFEDKVKFKTMLRKGKQQWSTFEYNHPGPFGLLYGKTGKDAPALEEAAGILQMMRKNWEEDRALLRVENLRVSDILFAQINSGVSDIPKSLFQQHKCQIRPIDKGKLRNHLKVASLSKSGNDKVVNVLRDRSLKIEEQTLTATIPLEKVGFCQRLIADVRRNDIVANANTKKKKAQLVSALCTGISKGPVSLQVFSSDPGTAKGFMDSVVDRLDRVRSKVLVFPRKLCYGAMGTLLPKKWVSSYGDTSKFKNGRNALDACEVKLDSPLSGDVIAVRLVGTEEAIMETERKILKDVGYAARKWKGYDNNVKMNCGTALVPINAGGAMIGKAGSTIKALADESGAEILFGGFVVHSDGSSWKTYKVGDSYDEGMQRMIHVVGTEDQVCAALKMIENVLTMHMHQSRAYNNHSSGNQRFNKVRKVRLTKWQHEKKVLNERAGETVIISSDMTLETLAARMKFQVNFLRKTLRKLGEKNIGPTSVVPSDIAELLALECGMAPELELEPCIDIERTDHSSDSNPDALKRHPIVTIMGHVDHGKTTLLDSLRKSSIGASEAGGITQSLGGFTYQNNEGVNITFIDTPGHAAFANMRETGVTAADINVVVISADDGIMPQTEEALRIAQKSDLPLLIALTKIDKVQNSTAEVEQRISNDLLGLQIVPEALGGDVPVLPISAVKNIGLADLVETIALHGDVLELKGDVNAPAEAVVLESSIVRGQGVVVDILMRWGSLKPKDFVVAGEEWGRVKRLTSEHGKNLKVVKPSVPARVLGFRSLPPAGVELFAVDSESKAQEVAEYRKEMRVKKQLAQEKEDWKEESKIYNRRAFKAKLKRVRFSGHRTLNTKRDQTEEETDPENPIYNIIFKGGSEGSMVALTSCADEAESQTGVQMRTIRTETGEITVSDVNAAADASATIFGFNTKVTKEAKAEARKLGVEIILHKIIYKLQDDLIENMFGLLPPVFKEQSLGKAEVLQIFEINGRSRGEKIPVNGMKVTDGRLDKKHQFRVMRNGETIFDGLSVDSMRHFKEEASETKKGGECGLQLTVNHQSSVNANAEESVNSQDRVELQPQDIVECYELIQVEHKRKS
jgi:small GTP-binding protein